MPFRITTTKIDLNTFTSRYFFTFLAGYILTFYMLLWKCWYHTWNRSKKVRFKGKTYSEINQLKAPYCEISFCLRIRLLTETKVSNMSIRGVTISAGRETPLHVCIALSRFYNWWLRPGHKLAVCQSVQFLCEREITSIHAHDSSLYWIIIIDSTNS